MKKLTSILAALLSVVIIFASAVSLVSAYDAAPAYSVTAVETAQTAAAVEDDAEPDPGDAEEPEDEPGENNVFVFIRQFRKVLRSVLDILFKFINVIIPITG